MLKKLFFETPLKKSLPMIVLFWCLYFLGVIGAQKLVFMNTEPDSWLQIILVGGIVALSMGGVLSLMVTTSLLLAGVVIRMDERQLLEEQDEVAKIFEKTDKVEVTIAEVNDSIESAIVNELETNDEICLFAELVGNEISISIKMKDGKEYPGVIKYIPENYAEFLEEFVIL